MKHILTNELYWYAWCIIRSLNIWLNWALGRFFSARGCPRTQGIALATAWNGWKINFVLGDLLVNLFCCCSQSLYIGFILNSFAVRKVDQPSRKPQKRKANNLNESDGKRPKLEGILDHQGFSIHSDLNSSFIIDYTITCIFQMCIFMNLFFYFRKLNFYEIYLY